MDLGILIIYSLASALILFYSLSQLSLLLLYRRSVKDKDDSPKYDLSFPENLPFVTIQLPLYNEKYVVERLLRNIAEIEYPQEKLEIQVLDDSTDESLENTALLVQELRQKGVNIRHLLREERIGFKAGALKEGLKTATGELIAVFDADFLPKKDWLQQTVPWFKDPELGVVQTRWGHINRNYSILTKVMAFALDFHFIVEQSGRNYGKHFMNFNGTAGIWRKQCIVDAGNWAGDTLTEDLDLSYRAQLKKWKFKYLQDVETPAELPVIISAVRSQQFRWNKGAAENFRKNFSLLLKDKSQASSTKIHGFFHLLNSSLFVLLLLLAILSIPVLYIQNSNPQFNGYFKLMGVFAISAIIFFACYWITWKKLNGNGFRSFFRFLGMFFAFFSVAMGLSVHNSIAVLEGHLGKKSDFVRTPKFNIHSVKDSWKGNVYISKEFSVTNFIEIFLLLYFCFGIYSAIKLNDYGLLIFHMMLVAGFGFVVFSSLNPKR
ncbi:cellulose synthase family protein [Zunongwangia sp. H14]|uniref:cellulose synthase family protein n=1 Tax=Zunongwangia sp. H14 TaxID=3240792 RepID=UPI00356A4FD8